MRRRDHDAAPTTTRGRNFRSCAVTKRADATDPPTLDDGLLRYAIITPRSLCPVLTRSYAAELNPERSLTETVTNSTDQLVPVSIHRDVPFSSRDTPQFLAQGNGLGTRTP